MRPTLPAAGFCSGLLSACFLPPSPLWPWTTLFPWVPAGIALVLYLLTVLGLLLFHPPAG